MVAVMMKYLERTFSRGFQPTAKQTVTQGRPYQRVVALSDLSPVDRAELADRLEAEFARL